MNKDDSQLYRTKNKLRELKERRVKVVTWKLTKTQKEYIEDLGYKVTPYLYEVRTKTLKNLHNVKNHTLKEIHYSSKKGKKTIVLKLKQDDMEVLDEYHIKFYPVKFKIQLVS